MTQAHLDLQSQLDSQNISNISDPSTTPSCNISPISFVSPIEPTNNQIEQMDTTHKSSDTDNNETSSQNHKPHEQPPSTPPPSKKKKDIMKDPIFPIKHLVSAPLNDKEKSYYTALSKQAYSYNELMFISATINAFMVKAEKAKSETQYTTPEYFTPKSPTTTTDKLNNVLTSRTLPDLTHKLEPYKKNPSDSPLATLTHILDCYDHTLKILQSLDIDSQRITQSSKAIQTTLDNSNIVFFLNLYNASQVIFTFFFFWYMPTLFKLFNTGKLFKFCHFWNINLTPFELILTHTLHYDFGTIFLMKLIDHWPFNFSNFFQSLLLSHILNYDTI